MGPMKEKIVWSSILIVVIIGILIAIITVRGSSTAQATSQPEQLPATTFVTVGYDELPDSTSVSVIRHRATNACYVIVHRGWQNIAITETAKEVCDTYAR